MLLRREIHLFLWVSALTLIGLALFHGTLIRSLVSTREAEYSTNESVGDRAPSLDVAAVDAQEWKRDFVEVAPGIRPLFPVQQENVAASETEVGTAAAAEPTLKGILGTGTGLKAVFLDPDVATYAVIGVGETIAGYEVVAVESGQVLARSADGEVTFYLRGAGENP